MTREDAWCLLTEFTLSESLRKHALSVEACLRAYARKFGEDEELWGIVGLIHDFDYEKYPSAEEHPYKGNAILAERGWPEEIRRAIMSHADYTGSQPRLEAGEDALCLRRARRVHHRHRAGEAQQVAGRGRREVGTQADEGQSLRPLGQPRGHHQRRGRPGRRPGRAHHLLHRGDERRGGGTGSGGDESAMHLLLSAEPEATVPSTYLKLAQLCLC